MNRLIIFTIEAAAVTILVIAAVSWATTNPDTELGQLLPNITNAQAAADQAGVRTQFDEAVDVLAAAGAPGLTEARPATVGPIPTPPDQADIVTVTGTTISVHHSIVDDVTRLVTDAQADGVDLDGWGWRSHQRQVELREAHCGGTEYDIWSKPSSQCNPPTARPGASMHEQGLAIDFTYQGSVIGSRDSVAFVWLNQHGHRYGLANLPSEPWHWSTTGR